MDETIDDADFDSISISRTATGPSYARSNGPSAARPAPALDRNNANNTTNKPAGVVQPKPQALPKRTGPSSIIVAPRQKGNPILNHVKSMPWEYGDIPADYVLGTTTCALFLSLKYHRLHPEYIYTRIKGLQGKYNLRLVLVLVDINNHEESLKELSKTSLINNVTLILCWSAQEGGRYLELFKTYENAAPTSIKQHQSTTYSDRIVDFITTPRSINKTDAVSLVSQFGSVRTAVNARHEDVAGIAGWGEKKLQRWCAAVREPFRIQRTAKRGLERDETGLSQAPALSRSVTEVEETDPSMLGSGSGAPGLAVPDNDADRRPRSRLAERMDLANFAEDEEALAEAITGPPVPSKRAAEVAQAVPAKKRKQDDDPLDDGVMAALNKLRKT